MPKIHKKIYFLLSITIAAGCTDLGTEPEFRDPFSYPADIQASWSPDGTWIVYRHQDYYSTDYDSTYPNGLYLIDPDGNNRRLLVQGDAFLPSWSPNTQQIVFTTSAALYITNIDGSGREYVTGGRFPRWSPDGQRIIFTRPGTQDTVGIWIVDLSSGREHRLGFGAMPDWSPDGKRIVYSGPPGTTRSGSQIWTMDSSGSQNVQLTQNSFISNLYPRWSPDGIGITWHVLAKAEGEIWTMNSDGRNQRKLANGLHPSWSPDPQTIVFSDFDPSGTKIVLWRVDLDGTNLRQLTH
jgi:Tol biopolymer transport system component